LIEINGAPKVRPTTEHVFDSAHSELAVAAHTTARRVWDRMRHFSGGEYSRAKRSRAKNNKS
jgi:hypothetical protein